MLKRNKNLLQKKWLRRTALFFFCWVLVHTTYITIDGLNDYKGKADVAVVLGNRVFPDGSLSSWLKGRVDKALQLYRQGRVQKIYVSGGVNTKEEGDNAEGDAMKAYLVKQGVPETDVIADNNGQNTYLTAKDFMQWNESRHYTSVIVVSQFYHITRSKYILRKQGFKNVFNASSDVYSWKDVIGTLREVPAFYKYMLFY